MPLEKVVADKRALGSSVNKGALAQSEQQVPADLSASETSARRRGPWVRTRAPSPRWVLKLVLTSSISERVTED